MNPNPTLVVQEGDFVGLTCIECDAELNPGDTYSEKLVGFHEDIPIVEIVCSVCALSD